MKTLALSLVKRRVREVVRRNSGGAAAERGAAGDARSEGGPCGGVGVRPKRGTAPPERRGPWWRYGSGGHSLHRYPELAGFVDEVLGDAGAGERDDALRQEVQQLVVAPERSGPSVCVPVRFVNNLCYLNLFRPGYRNNKLLLFNIIFTPETRRTSTLKYT